jgi:hypothetical protein
MARSRLLTSLRPEYLAAIGEIITLWGALEVAIDQAIQRILRSPVGTLEAVTLGLNIQFRLDMLQGLAETTIHGREAHESLLRLIAEIRTSDADRNFIVHALWVQGEKDIAGGVGRRNKPGYRGETWDLTKLRAIALTASELNGELLNWTYHTPFRRKHVAWTERRLLLPLQNLRKPARARKRAKRKPPHASSRT